MQSYRSFFMKENLFKRSLATVVAFELRLLCIYLSESTRWLVDGVVMLGLEDMLEEIGFILSFELDEIRSRSVFDSFIDVNGGSDSKNSFELEIDGSLVSITGP